NDFVNPVVPEEEFSSDYYLFAVDPLNAKRILIQEPFTQFDEFARIRELPVGRVTTAFIWYSGNTWYKHFEERESIFFTGFPYLKTTMNLTYLKSNSYKNFNADVLEIQISPGEITNALTDHEVASAVDKDLRSIMPELPPFLDFRVHRIDNFSSVTVGSEKTRPPIFNSLDNFFILGDYVSLKHNAIFMEKVTVVAKTVVNHILEREHLNEAKIKILSSETPNLMVKTIRKVLHVL
ncbi:MAG: FAD-dependent oxidoreductase, partial [Deltaproteobacteria bacterium]|nr:FAD-dependent oxidoreductase [Deltaproteobacteria bacterium]